LPPKGQEPLALIEDTIVGSNLFNSNIAGESRLHKLSIGKLTTFFSLSRNSRRFKRYAKPRRNSDFEGSKVILVENRTWATDVWALLHFVPHLSSFHRAKVLIYDFRISRVSFNLKQKIKHKSSILNSFAPSRLHQFLAKPKVCKNHIEILKVLTSGSLSKSEFESFKYRNIIIGDIVYDEFLRTKDTVTLDFASTSFSFFTSTVLQFCDQLLEYFQTQNVKAVVVSHHNYKFALPARVAMMYGIEAYRLDIFGLVKITSSHPNSYLSSIEDLRLDLENLSFNERNQGQRLAVDKIQERLKGNVQDLGMLKHEEIAIEREGIKSLFNTEKIVVLVALHDFHDAVHAYGIGFYPDFAEWLEDVGRVTQGKRVTCLIKPHPYQRQNVDNFLQATCDRFSHFKLISPFTSNLNLVSWGLRHCLTVYGSVAHELPYLGVKVINASANNPHRDFNFSYSPRDLGEYRNILGSLDSFEFQPDVPSLLDYYFMRFIIGRPSWHLQNIRDFMKCVGSFSEPDYEKAIRYFLDEVRLDLRCNEQAVHRFLKSSDLSFKQKHYEPSKCVSPESCYCKTMQSLDDILKPRLE
jgi:hypothetical protein